MIEDVNKNSGKRGRRWRIARWTAAALLLLTPLVAMQFTDEVDWDEEDFIFMGILLGGTGAAYELAVRKTSNLTYRGGVAVALGTAFFLIWAVGAVGVIGDESNPANLMYGGVLAIGIIGALVARFRPRGMAYALLATALAQTSVGAIALIAGLGSPSSGPLEILGLTGMYAALWLISAGLFWKAARGRDTDFAKKP